MRWTTFFTISAFLILANVSVNAQNLPTSLPTNTPSIPASFPSNTPSTPDISRYVEPPSETRDLVSNVRPSQLNQLPPSLQREAARVLEGQVESLRVAAQAGSPVANGRIPTGSQMSDVRSQNPTSSSSPTSSPTSDHRPPTSSIDPLSSITSYLSTTQVINTQSDISTFELATKQDVQLWKEYYEGTYDKISDLKDTYTDIKNLFTEYKDILDAMLSKLPATITNCTHT